MDRFDPVEIMDYLEDRMTKNQRIHFEERLVREPQLRLALEDYRPVQLGFKSLRLSEKLQQVGAWSQSPDPVTIEEPMIDQELIALYYSNQLPESLKTDFRARASMDPAFEQKLIAYQEVFAGFEAMQVEQIKSKVRQFAKAEDQPDTSRGADSEPFSTKQAVVPGPAKAAKMRRLIPAGLAAVLTAALIFAVYNWWPAQGNADQWTSYLEEQYEQPYNNLERSTQTGEEDLNDPYNMGVGFYKIDDHRSAIAKLESVPKEDSMYVRAHVLAGHSHFLRKEYVQAAEQFSEAAALLSKEQYSKKGLTSNEVRWNYFLALLGEYNSGKQIGDKEKLQSELEVFIKDLPEKSSYRQAAEKLQSLLNKE